MSNTVNYLASFRDIPAILDKVNHSKLTFIACTNEAVSKAIVTSLQTRFRRSIVIRYIQPNIVKVFNHDHLDK